MGRSVQSGRIGALFAYRVEEEREILRTSPKRSSPKFAPTKQHSSNTNNKHALRLMHEALEPFILPCNCATKAAGLP
jgi:hypothetical protein